ncbi:MAG: LysE family translocator [Paracoccaceae bacterium]|nr:LysE family translocator [Paracoccaceae bacterium]MDE3120534.1 LysE family translocator [Paracoccaceae bacterium]MDE3239734.1 LysE family translocator [Paracoccaceae bacterium]
MSFHGWTVFALFWVVFVTTPGPNAVNCISNGMQHGFARALWGVLAILTQAVLFLTLSALGIAALIAASPALYEGMKLAGAAVLIGLGIRGWLLAGRPPAKGHVAGHTIYGRALMIATINAKSVAGYLAAFTQFVQPHVPIWHQMGVIYPTALTITTLSYCGYTALGALMGRAAMGAATNLWFRRAMAAAFILYGLLLGASGGAAVPR